MRVRCSVNDISKFSDAALKRRLAQSIRREGANNDLVVGSDYVVLGVDWWSNDGVRIYLHTVEEISWPYPYPIEMFEVIDSSLPTGWCVTFEQQPSGLVIKSMGFPEWVNDDSFYERLLDDDEDALAVYKQLRNKLE